MQIIRNKQKQKLILESNNLYKSILILATPIFLSNFMKAMNDFVDMYFVSNFIEESIRSQSRTAISITFPVFSITLALAAGFMVAGSAIIAQFLGAKQRENAKRTAGQVLTLSITAGIVMNIILFIAAPTIMRWMGASGVELQLMIKYIRIRSFELIPLFSFFAFQASRQASGDTVTPFVMNIIMILVNIVTTFTLMYYYNLGVAGAAFGTVLGNFIIMPIYLYMMFRKNSKHISIDINDIRFDPIEINKIFKLSWPVSLSQAFTSFGFVILNAIIYSYGLATVNAFSVGNRINSLVLMPAMGIGGVVATFVGQNVGALNEKRARESVKAAMILAILISGIGSLIIFPFRETLLLLFLKGEPVALDLSMDYMFFLLAGLPLMGIFQVFMGSYQGSGETKFSLILSTVRLWGLRVPLVWFFKEKLNLPASSLWYAMVLSNFAAAYVGTVLYSRCKFKPKVKINRIKERKQEACLT